MKKFRYILPCFLLGLTLSSCNGFLDKEPWDSIDTSKSFQAAEDAIAAVMVLINRFNGPSYIICVCGHWIS